MKLSSSLKLFVAIAALALVTGCAATQPVTGMIYADVAGPVAVTATQMGPRHGQACATSYFGLVGLGDASVSAAAKNGGVANISHVEQHSNNIIGYMKYCTDVWGYGPRAAAPAAKSGALSTPATAVQTAAGVTSTTTGAETAIK